jgi:RimJ/RimL family protein N-acetyltransferase
MSVSEPMRHRAPSQAAVEDPSPRPRPDHVAIEGRYVTVEPLDVAAHGADLFAAGSGDVQKTRIWDYLPYGPFPMEADMRAHLEKQEQSSDPLFFAIRPKASGKAEGVASLMRIDPTNGVIEIGHIWLGPSLQQTPAATEALFLLIAHAMDDLGYRRMEWKSNAANAGSRGAATRLGFIYEGTFYQHVIVKLRNRDTAWFSILDSEWPAIRANFETWLDPANFDERGKQRHSLGEVNRGLAMSRTGDPSTAA